MSINYPMGFGKEQLAALMNEANESEVDYSELDWGVPTVYEGTQNASVVVTGTPDGAVEGTQTIFYNRLNLGELFQGINPSLDGYYGEDKLTAFRAFLTKYGLPVDYTDGVITDPEAIVETETTTFVVGAGAYAYSGTVTVTTPLPANHLSKLYPGEAINAWNLPSGAAETIMADKDPEVPGVINYTGQLLSYRYQIDEATWNYMWEEYIFPELGIDKIEDAVGTTLGDPDNTATLDGLILGLFGMWGPWKMDYADDKTPFNLKGAKITAYRKLEPTTGSVAGDWSENLRQYPDVKYVMEFELSSNFYSNVHGHFTVYVY